MLEARHFYQFLIVIFVCWEFIVFELMYFILVPILDQAHLLDREKFHQILRLGFCRFGDVRSLHFC